MSGVDSISAIPGVNDSYIKPINVSDKISEPDRKTSRFGPILISGDTRSDVERTIDNVRKAISIQVMTSEGLRPVTWH